MESAGMFRTLSDFAAKAGLRLDSIMNLYSGLGDALYDRTKHNIFEPNRKLGDAELSALYNDEPIGRLICELPTFDALRKGFTITVEGDDGKTGAAAYDYLKRLNATHAFSSANELDRAFGGAGIWVGVDDGGEQSEPVNVGRVKRILFLRVLDRRRLRPWVIDQDTRSETYNQPVVWAVMPEEVFSANAEAAKLLQPVTLVHASRLIIFPGRNVSDDRRQANNGWGDSIFQACLNPLENDASAWATLAHLVTKASQGVLKVKDLAMVATSGDPEAVKARFQLIRMGRSVVKDLVIDAEEDYQQTPPNFGNLPDVLYLCMYQVASAVQIPVTRLYGMSPGGLNSTGESDARNWEDVVEALQTHRLEPRIRQLLDLVFLAQDGPTKGTAPKSYELMWEPLRQMTLKEQAEVREIVARTDAIYINAQVLTPEEVCINRFRADGWSMETQVDLELRQKILEAELDQALEDVENPPEPPPVPPTDPSAPTPPEPVDGAGPGLQQGQSGAGVPPSRAVPPRRAA
jgi:uncharacterized protein